MPKAERGLESSLVGQLKKELRDASQMFQSLQSRIDQIEKCLIESQTTIAKQTSLTQEVAASKTELEKVRAEQERDLDSFTISTARLKDSFDARCLKFQQDCETEVTKEQRKSVEIEQEWQKKLAIAQRDIESLKVREGNSSREMSTKASKLEQAFQIKATAADAQIRKLSEQVKGLKDENEKLSAESEQQDLILKGRETEKQQLAAKLASLETFATISDEDVRTKLTDIKNVVDKFCDECVASSDLLPGWRSLPEFTPHTVLPDLYHTESASGQAVVKLAIRHAICALMMKIVFTAIPCCGCQGMAVVPEALFRANRLHESVWRCMLSRVVLNDYEIMQEAKTRYASVAKELFTSLNLFRQPKLQQSMEGKLVDILNQGLTTWLILMTLRDKIDISHNGASGNYDYEDDNGKDAIESAKMPGDYESIPVPPSLLLFPAFLRLSSTERRMQTNVIMKGVLVSRDARVIAQAWAEAEKVRSPKLSN